MNHRQSTQLKSCHRPSATGDRFQPSVLLLCLLLAFAAFAVFGQTLGHGFLNLDDFFLVTANPHVFKGLSLDNVQWAFTAGLKQKPVDTDFWRPLSQLSHMTDVQIFGLRAWGHHLVNVLLHALSAILLFLVLRSMTGTLWRSFFVAAFFAVHPLRVESVAWVAERKDMLSGLFFMLSLGAYVRYVFRSFSLWNYFLVLGCFLFGLMSKPMLVTLPFVLLLLDFWPLRRISGNDGVSWKRLILEKIPLFAMSAVSAWVTTMGPGGMNSVLMETLSFTSRLANASVSVAVYCRQTVWPEGLALWYPHRGASLSPWSVGASMLLLVTVTIVVLLQYQRRYLLVGWFWFLGMLLPVLGLIQSGGQAHADRYTYLPQIGLFLAMTWLAADWAGKIRQRCLLLSWMGAALVAALMLVTARQASYWKDGIALWTRTLACTQQNALAHHEIAVEWSDRGDLAAAQAHCREALRIDAGFADARGLLGHILLLQGNNGDAIRELSQALSASPDKWIFHDDMGNAFLRVGKTGEALAWFCEAVRLNPSSPIARSDLSHAMMILGRTQEALNESAKAVSLYREAIRLDPSSEGTRRALGVEMFRMGREGEAIAETKAVLAMDHENPEACNNLAWMLATAREDALRDGKRALELALRSQGTGKDPNLLETLAAAQAETGDYPSAINTAQRAMDLASGDRELEANLRTEITFYKAKTPYRRGADGVGSFTP